MPTVWPSCATYLLSCLEQFSLDVVPDILSGPISYTCRCAHMQVEDLLEMIACLRVFKLSNFEARGELALGFWRHIKHIKCLPPEFDFNAEIQNLLPYLEHCNRYEMSLPIFW